MRFAVAEQLIDTIAGGQRSGGARVAGVGGLKTANVDPWAAGVAIGITDRGGGPTDYQIACLIQQVTPQTPTLIAMLRAAVNGEVVVQNVGRIEAPRMVPHAGPAARSPLQNRQRPLCPGVSVAHPQVTAGTLGAFITIGRGPEPHILSNNHVLANSAVVPGLNPVGVATFQPGPADGGTGRDIIGHLSHYAGLSTTSSNRMDAAVSLLHPREAFDPSFPHRVTTSRAAIQGERVWKLGRTTGLTTGRVVSTRVRAMRVHYGPHAVRFDYQYQLVGDAGPFSAGGDSGSLVVAEDGAAVGLIFAGSADGSFSFANPLPDVLAHFGATLLT